MQFNNLIPELKVSNLSKSLNFYVKIGFKAEYKRPESKFVFLSFQGSQIMLEEVNDDWKTGKLSYPFGRGISFQMKVKSIIPIINLLKKSKYGLFIGPHEKWYRKNDKMLGNRQFLVQDPDGYLLRFFEDITHK
ncbi:MAG: VOC family protein [Nanoarchaeota archaeon]